MDTSDTPLLDTMRAASEGSATPRLGADLLDADMLYQRNAVLHSGCAVGPALTARQRRVLHAEIGSQEGEVVAVGDEDGLAALRAAAATLVVDHAIADEQPPLIAVLAPGTQLAADDALGCARWLPLPKGLGDRELYQACSDPAWLERARSGFLGSAGRYLGRDASGMELHAVRMSLRGRLDRINSARMILTNVVAAGAEPRSVGLQVGRLAELCGLGRDEVSAIEAATGSLREVDAALDAVRVHELELSVHLFECVWLEYAEGGALLSREEVGSPRYHDLDAFWCQVSALRPVHALSADSVAEGFRYCRGNGEEASATGMLDLLGVTGAEGLEAGRPLLAFSLARRALVTGQDDDGAAGDAGAVDPSSLLAAAERACRWDFGA